MNHALDLVCFGGPQDGMRVRTLPCTTFSFDQVRLASGEVTKDVYALEATPDGRLRLRYLSTQTEPIT